MANEETVGTIVQKLALDMKEFETSIKKAETLSKALKTSMNDLGSLTVDPSGKLKKSLDDYAVNTDKATQTTREFFRENRQQDRIFKESIQSITSATFALAFLTQGNNNAEDATKKLTSALVSGVGAANAAEFAFFGMGKAGEQIGGKLGGALSRIGNMAGPLSMVVGVLTSVITYVREAEQRIADLDKSIYGKQVKLGIVGPEEVLKKARQSLAEAKKAEQEARENTLIKDLISPMISAGGTIGFIIKQVYGDANEEQKKAFDTLLEKQLEVREAEEALKRVTDKRYADMIRREDELDRLRAMAAERQKRMREEAEAAEVRSRVLYGPDKPAFIDQEYEQTMAAGERGYRQYTERWQRFQEWLGNEQIRIEERTQQMREAGWQRDASAIQTLTATLQSGFNIAGDSLLGKMLQMMQVAAQIARALRFANSAEGEGLSGVLGVISAIVPGIGLFLNRSGSTPSPASDSVNSAYSRASGPGGMNIRISGNVDLSNGKLFLIQEMPGYNSHLTSKTV